MDAIKKKKEETGEEKGGGSYLRNGGIPSYPRRAESAQSAGRGEGVRKKAIPPPHGPRKIEVAATFPRSWGKRGRREPTLPSPPHEDPGSKRGGGSKEGRYSLIEK